MPPLSSNRIPVIGLLVALGLAGCGGSSERSSGTTQNGAKVVDKLILFTVDTLRADQLGVHGNQAYATPYLDRFASQSLVFERAYAQATLTVPALTSMLTGLLPDRHDVLGQRGALADNVVPLAQIAQARGIPTASFLANICVLQGEERTVFHDGWDLAYCGMDEHSEQYLWDQDVIRHALEWLDAQPGPFLLWVHLMDPHAEHRPNPADWDYTARPVREKFEQYRAFNQWEMERGFPSEEEAQHMWDLYGAEVRGVDREFGRFVDQVDAREDAAEIAMIFSADHGEELYETWSRYDHGLSLTEGVLWVPLMVRAPGLEPGMRDDVVETLQVTPTALELFDLPEPYALDGKSLLAPEPSRGFAVSQVGHITTSLRSRDFRFWHRKGKDPWQREAAQWRADAPWFRDRLTLAHYPTEKRTTVEFLSVTAPENNAKLVELGSQLQKLTESLGVIPSGRQVGDAETEAEFQKLGYTGYADLRGDE